MKKVTIHTDGACLGNPGPGGWAAILEYGKVTKELAGGELATTNNRMEMRAAIEALGVLREACEVELVTDSEYLRDGITKWIHGWKAKGWKKKIKNKDLWLQLDETVARHRLTWSWVRGHTGHPQNERCDVLATTEAKRLQEKHSRAELAEALAQFRQQQSDDEPVLL
ncbi:MAG: ribonuclease HI [Bryobacteraceae bacterium]|nr:ribonuclease HI [Bryobacteraceae bacterium]